MWNLYNRIEALCKEQKMNITQMCRELEMPRSIMSELKAGRTARLSAENSSKLSRYFNVSVDYFLNNSPFDVWEKIDSDRAGFFYHLHVPKSTLNTVWGIDKDNPDSANVGDIIRFLSCCIKSAYVDGSGGWFIDIVVEYENLWHTAIVQQNDAKKITPVPEFIGKGVKIPVLGVVRAGVPIEAEENIIDYEEISQSMAATGDFFALQIKGDSMEPRITEGDVVIVRKQSTVDNGEIAVVLVNGNEATIKKFYKTDNGIKLISTNAKYDPFFFTPAEVNSLPVSVIGKVVELRAKF